MYTVKAVWHRR